MTITQTRHSFIVCAYKKSPFLRDCILSLKKQTTPSIIRIATSTPNEFITSVADEFGLEVLINPISNGIASDWNFAMQQCETQYCTLAHQDDVYESQYTEKMLSVMTSDTLIGFSDYYELRGTTKTFDTLNLKIKRILLKGLSNKKNAGNRNIKRRALAFGNSICCPAVTYNVTRLPSNLFKTGMRSNVDWEAWEQLSRVSGDFQYVPVPLMAHRIHEQSETSLTIKDNQRTGEDLIMFKKFWPDAVAKALSRLYALSEKSNKE